MYIYLYVYTCVISVAAMAINNNAPENSTLPARDRNKRKKERGVLKNKKKTALACH